MSDLTLTFEHFRLLRLIRDCQPRDTFATSPLHDLHQADLVELTEDIEWALTETGAAALAAHDEAKTRRLPRPAPPKLPEGWRFAADLEAWVYEGRLADCVLEDPGPDDLEPDLERAEAQVALFRYLRASQAYARAGARIGADPVEAGDAASLSPLDRGDSAGREEPS